MKITNNQSAPARHLGQMGWLVLCLAAFFGITTGLLEGIGFVVFQKLDWLVWDMATWPVAIETIWISPGIDLFLFLLFGVSLIAAGKFAPRIPLYKAAIFSFVWFLVTDFLLLIGRVRAVGCIVLAAGIAVVFVRWSGSREERARKFVRKALPIAVSLWAIAWLGIEGGQRLAEARALEQRPAAMAGPNILVIVIDTLRADHLSALGYSRQTSPNIDRLASQGVLFANGVAASSWTLPSHASLLTGKYAGDHGALVKYFDGQSTTLGEVLQHLGYRTGGFSANLNFFTQGKGFGQGFDRFADVNHSVSDMFGRSVFGRKFIKLFWSRFISESRPGGKLAASVNREFLGWVRRGSPRPFFAVLNYFDVHDPYLPPDPYRGWFSERPDPGGIVNTFAERPWPVLSPQQLQGEMDAYDGAIRYVDTQIGSLLEELARSNLLQNTVVVVTSDHGESFGEHGLTGHRSSLYWHLIRVPIIIWRPGKLPSGRRILEPVSIAAIPASVLDLLGEKRAHAFPVPSLRKVWEVESATDAPDAPLSELHQLIWSKRIPVFYGSMISMIRGRWHYIRHEKLGEELYDWAADPREEKNLANEPEGKRICAEFAHSLEERLAKRSRTELTLALPGKHSDLPLAPKGRSASDGWRAAGHPWAGNTGH